MHGRYVDDLSVPSLNAIDEDVIVQNDKGAESRKDQKFQSQATNEA